MTQKEINLVFKIAVTIYEHPWFKKEKRTKEDVQNWVTKQLTDHKIYTILIGDKRMVVDKEYYDEFHNPKEEDNDNN
jgi:hypothetical protein